MATKRDLAFIQGDDPTAVITITRAGAAFSLVGRRIEILVKARRSTADASQLYRLSSVGASPKITVTNAAGGLAVADFADQFAASGQFWYRAWTSLTAAEDSDRQTFNYGELRISPA